MNEDTKIFFFLIQNSKSIGISNTFLYFLIRRIEILKLLLHKYFFFLTYWKTFNINRFFNPIKQSTIKIIFYIICLEIYNKTYMYMKTCKKLRYPNNYFFLILFLSSITACKELDTWGFEIGGDMQEDVLRIWPSNNISYKQLSDSWI